MECASVELKADKQIILEAISHGRMYVRNMALNSHCAAFALDVLSSASSELQGDYDVAFAAVNNVVFSHRCPLDEEEYAIWR